jgi:hypothetical protein
MRNISIISFFLLLFGAVAVEAQQVPTTVIDGSVRFKENGEAVVGANVLLMDEDGKVVLGFASTDSDGNYAIRYNARRDTVVLKVTGFNVKPVIRTVPLRNQTVNFEVEYDKIAIREVVVKAKPVERRGDTLNYYVSSYIDSLDRNIGDVLRKMPGIDVKSNGQILYNNKAINRFYIEGLDMMGGGYGQAVNNVRAGDIASVQVLENHQPVKMLEGISFSDKAAINLKLRNKSKGTFTSTVTLGGGYKPYMWYAAIAAMQFSAGHQFLATFKTNDCGEDITSELNSFYDGLADLNPIAYVHTPSTPGVDRERYMDNITHALSTNALFKLDSDRTITVKCKYIHDFEKFASQSRTVYYLPDAEPLEIAENTFAAEKGDAMEIGMHYNGNSSKRYVDESFTARADFDSHYGYVKTGEDSVAQRYDGTPKVRFDNRFHSYKVVRGCRLSFMSTTDYGQLPDELTVTPVVFPEIFGEEKIDVGSVVQYANTRKFDTKNSVNFDWRIKNFGIAGGLGANADIERLKSSLCRTDSSGSLMTSPDSLTNDIYWRRLDVLMPLYLSYYDGDLSISFSATADYMNLHINDAVRGTDREMNRVFVNPSLMISGKISPDLKYHFYAFTGNELGSGASNICSGYVMSDYRVVSSYDGKIAEAKSANLSAGLDYGNALVSVFGTLEASYYRRKSNLMYGYEYSGSLTRIESYAIDNMTQGYSLSGRIEKRFDDIATTVGMPVSYSRSYLSVLRQGTVMPTACWSLPVGLNISTDMLKRMLRINYSLTCSRSQSIIYGSTDKLDPIDALSQKLDVNVTAVKGLTFNVTGEHYYNSEVENGSRSMFFLDAGVTYKTPTVEYILAGRNLLNTTSFNQALYTDITAYSYVYKLRPWSLMFKVRFNIR